MSENGDSNGMDSTNEGEERLTSVGIDVGTTTTQVVVSELRMGSAGPAGEKLEITDRTISHRGEIHATPLLDAETVDIDAVAAIVEKELAAAGLSSEEIDTGAVIVTGETASKENAEPLVHRLATESGEFVAAAAGAALEAILAGQGSGAATRAAETGGVVANVDVGGGTTNVATFDPDGVRDTRCLDVGGRLVRFDSAGTITDVSEPARELAAGLGIGVSVGSQPTEDDLDRLATAMADRIVDAVAGPPFDERTRSLAIDALPTETVDVDSVAFTGGVGRLVYATDEGTGSDSDTSDDPITYGDFGPALATAIRRAASELPVVRLDEEIRATVVGVGTRTTKLSGRTITLEEALLPLRNLPVVSTGDLGDGDPSTLDDRLGATLRTAADRHGADTTVVLAIDDIGRLTYDRLEAVADAITAAYLKTDEGRHRPVVVLTRQNCAKALGQALRRRIDGRPVLVIDEVGAGTGDYLDIGMPLDGGETVPVVVKTLAF